MSLSEKIAELEAELESYRSGSAVAKLERELELKDEEIDELNTELRNFEDMDDSVEEWKTQFKAIERLIEEVSDNADDLSRALNNMV